jgi:TorA maturation chaperone TorD
MLRAYAAKIEGADLEKVRTDLASEYAALFLNASRRAVHPFESVYTSAERLIMQRARDEVLTEYRKEGLDRVGDFREPEDHIAIELEFMAYLCQKAAGAVEAGDKAAALEYLNRQDSFLKKHLLVWVPEFCQDVQRATKIGFYKGIARITEEHLAHEGETIAELVEAVKSIEEG